MNTCNINFKNRFTYPSPLEEVEGGLNIRQKVQSPQSGSFFLGQSFSREDLKKTDEAHSIPDVLKQLIHVHWGMVLGQVHVDPVRKRLLLNPLLLICNDRKYAKLKIFEDNSIVTQVWDI